MRTFGITSALVATVLLAGCERGAEMAQPANDVSEQASGPTVVDDSLGQSSTNEIPVPADAPSNPAIQTTEGNTAAAPVVGENSFTMGEAETHIEGRGFTDVSDLVLDDQGIWRGMANHNGTAVRVALDFQGNVFSE